MLLRGGGVEEYHAHSTLRIGSGTQPGHTDRMNTSLLLPPENVVCEGYVFTPVYDSVNGGGACVAGGHACPGGGACMPSGGVWLGVCMCPGGVHGEGGCMAKGGAWWRGACMVKGACVAKGGMHGEGRACVECTPTSTRYSRSMRGRYASYWNAFLLFLVVNHSRGFYWWLFCTRQYPVCSLITEWHSCTHSIPYCYA